MRKIICLFLLAFATINIATASGYSAKKIPQAADPGASFQKMWVDYGITVDNRYGMMMHVAFTVYNMKNIPGQLAFYFKYNDGKSDSWIVHRKSGDNYHSPNGSLGVSKNLTPTYDASVYDDVQVFFPYEEFGLDPGTYDLTIDVQWKYPGGTGIAWLQLYEIEFTQYEKSRGAGTPGGVAKHRQLPTTGPRAVFDTMWVDYDVKEDDVLGMRIHFKFTAYDMKDIEGLVAVYYEYNDAQGGVLRDRNNRYTSSGGDVAVYKSIYPAYPTTIYDDLQVFMPYDELELTAGKYQLLMDTKLIYPKGGIISNFTYHSFNYTEPAR